MQPAGVYRARSDAGITAFTMHLYLTADEAAAADDPAVAAVAGCVAREGPLRPGERIHVNRFLGDSGHYQRHPMAYLVASVSSQLEWVRNPAAWTYVTTVEPSFWGPILEYLGMRRYFALDLFGRELVGYGWDRRRFPPASLFELMTRRELVWETGPPPESMMRPAPLSREEFATAVARALSQLGRPDLLASSRLLDSALVNPAAPAVVDSLRKVILATIAALGEEPNGKDKRAILERTYLKGAPSQEAAAGLLGLPFSTYRRHLSRAHERLVDVLWAYEIGTLAAPHLAGTET